MSPISRAIDFQTEGQLHGKMNDFLNVMVFVCGTGRFFESEEDRRCLDGEWTEEGQKDREGLCQRKRSARVLTACARYLF